MTSIEENILLRKDAMDGNLSKYFRIITVYFCF